MTLTVGGTKRSWFQVTTARGRSCNEPMLSERNFHPVDRTAITIGLWVKAG
jgi:hypothetical protein